MKSISLLVLLAGVACLLAMVPMAQAEGDMVDVELVDSLDLHMHGLTEKDLRLTKLEKYYLNQMKQDNSMIEASSESQAEAEAEVDAEAEDALDTEAELDVEAETDAEAEAELDDAAEMDDASEAEDAAEEAAEAEEEPVFLEEDALVETEAETEVDAEAEAEVDARPAPVLNPNLVKPTIEKGTKGLPEPPKPAPGTRKDKYSKLRPCPKKRGAKPAALIEMEAEAEAEAEAQMEAESEAEMEAEDEPKAAAQDDTKPRKIHVHVTTKSVGAAAQSLQVLENRFDTLHDRMIGRLNKLMSRIERHPDSIEDKVAAYSFGTQPTKP